MKKTILILITFLTLISTAAAPLPQPGGFQEMPTTTPGEPAATPSASQLQSGTLEISSDSSNQMKMPGETATYGLTITNKTGAKQSITITATPGAAKWNTWVSPETVELEDQASTNVVISVVVKADALQGDADVTEVSASDTNGNKAVPVSLTTRAILPTPTLPPTATSEPQPTATLAPTIPPSLVRPMVMVKGYDTDGSVDAGEDFDMEASFINNGQTQAMNVVVSFTSDLILMRQNGGVRALGNLASGAGAQISQPMTVAAALTGQTAALVTLKISYNDQNGETYSDTFSLSVPLKSPTATATPLWGGVAKATNTPTLAPRSQLVVNGYQASVDPLQPGTAFDLEIQVHNTGSADAKSVSMVLGGGATTDTSSGTPVPGGTTGGSSDLTNFAPLGASNLMSLGDIAQGGTLKVKVRLIVNVTTAPGAYPLKLSFVYTNGKNDTFIDNQVITLLVYSLPQVEVVFYRDPGMLTVGQPGQLPIQVTNLGRKSAVLGSMKVTSNDAEVTNNVVQVGNVDPGGYFPLDAMAIPSAAGPVTLTVTINYNDDFNQLRTIIQTLKVMAVENSDPTMMGTPGAGMNGVPGIKGEPGMMGDGTIVNMGAAPVDESLWDKVLRLIKGFFGLDSATPQPETVPMPEGVPEGEPSSLPAGKG